MGVQEDIEIRVYYAEDLQPAPELLPDQPAITPEPPELPFELPRD